MARASGRDLKEGEPTQLDFQRLHQQYFQLLPSLHYKSYQEHSNVELSANKVRCENSPKKINNSNNQDSRAWRESSEGHMGLKF